MNGIYKSYGADNVLSDVRFHILGGEICAVLGKSGAGRSTLANILGGVLSADKGEILIDDAPVRFMRPADAANAGIAVVHQHPGVIHDLKVYEYMFLGREIKEYGILDNPFMISETGRILTEIGSFANPLAYMGGLNGSERAAVDVCRAFLSGSPVIILDKSIDALSSAAAERALDILTGFRIEGRGIVLITDSITYALRVSTRFAIMRDGAVIDIPPGQANIAILNRLLNLDYLNPAVRRRFSGKYPILEIRAPNSSIRLYKGEILGLTGWPGDTILRLMGLKKPGKEKVLLEGKSARISGPAAARRIGILYMPRKWMSAGVFPDMNAMDNISVTSWRNISVFGFISQKRQEHVYEAQAKLLKIRFGGRHGAMRAFSGGSQQKAVLARLLLQKPKILILDNPTEGVQIADRADIHDLIRDMPKQGISIILLSDDRNEISDLCDRALFIRDNKVTAELSGGQLNMESIDGLFAAEADEYVQREKSDR